MKKCKSLVSYFSDRANKILCAVFVDQDQTKLYIKNSFESIWIESDKVTLIKNQ